MTVERLKAMLPNMLTMLRIMMVPVFGVALLGGGPDWRLAVLVVFVVASLTDKLDGWLARKWGQVSDLGIILDPIADKLLVGTALVGLSWLDELPWWITATIMVREIGITVMRFFLLRYVVLPASSGGKVKTVLQSVAIGFFLLPLTNLPEAISWVAWVVMAAALVVTVVTGFDYVRTAVRVFRESR